MSSRRPALSEHDDPIEAHFKRRYGLTTTRWMLDVVASLRGRSGRLPIDSQGIAAALGIKISETRSATSFGTTIATSESEFEILLDPELTNAERNFTVAHELGHVFFFRASDGKFQTGSSLENLCDLFGAYLLAPLTFVDAYLKDSGAEIEAIRQLAWTLNIPDRALWSLLGEHYPLTFWWSRMGHLDWIGRFDVAPFEADLQDFCSSRSTFMRERIRRESVGVPEWVLEGALNSEGAHGILKPAGRNVRSRAVVRSINFPRELLLAEESGDWDVKGLRNRIGGC